MGWMPWDYGAQSGIVKKWADKYGIEIDVVQINDYVESINQYTAGAFDGCVMTNMDALTIPAAGGVDSTALIVGRLLQRQRRRDPQGQDALAGHQGPEGQPGGTLGVALSAGTRPGQRWSKRAGPDGGEYVGRRSWCRPTASRDVTAVVTWNPLLSEILAMPDTLQGVRFQPDPRRDHRHDGGEHRDAHGESEARQGPDGCLV